MDVNWRRVFCADLQEVKSNNLVFVMRGRSFTAEKIQVNRGLFEVRTKPLLHTCFPSLKLNNHNIATIEWAFRSCE